MLKIAEECKCTLCTIRDDNFVVTGIKIINEKEAAYRLCANCCKELHGLSFYSPAESKKRREFWERVWSRLDAETA